jgi:excisionase family DNA binding protein
MYTVKQAAERLGVCTSVVYDLVATGALPHYRIGKQGCRGSIRIERVDLEAYLVSQRREEKPKVSNPPARKAKNAFRHIKVN